MKARAMDDGVLIGSEADFAAFLALFDTPQFRSTIAGKLGGQPADAGARLDTYFAEMRFGHRFLAKRMPAGRLRILEIGAGLGLLSIWLKRQGHDVVALEPAGHAFGLFEATREEIWRVCGEEVPQLLRHGAEALAPHRNGDFDFIFSINVMEHVADPGAVFAAVSSVLRDMGTWLNACPNYRVPYEPHYAIPMVPFSPALTRRVFARRIDADPDIWDTLNFIDIPTVRRLAGKNGLKAEFEPAVLHSSLARLGQDPQFMERHRNGMVGRIYTLLKRLRLLDLTRHLPVSLNTPMIFRLRKHAQE